MEESSAGASATGASTPWTASHRSCDARSRSLCFLRPSGIDNVAPSGEAVGHEKNPAKVVISTITAIRASDCLNRDFGESESAASDSETMHDATTGIQMAGNSRELNWATVIPRTVAASLRADPCQNQAASRIISAGAIASTG